MDIIRDEAVLLGVTDYLESDRIASLYTCRHGKIRVIARGAKKSVRRFSGVLEPFARVEVEVRLSSGLHALRTGDAVTIYPGIRADLLKIAHAGNACELVDMLLPENMANPRVYRLLRCRLEHLDTNPPSLSDRIFFDLNLLNILGYRPDLDCCIDCGVPLTDGGYGLPEGLSCRRCRRGGCHLSGGSVALLKRSLATGRFGSVLFPPAEASEAALFLEKTIGSHLPKPLKSADFLREMECRPGAKGA